MALQELLLAEACFPSPSGIDLRKHFPPRPRKTAWHSDITNVIWPHGVPQTRLDTTMQDQAPWTLPRVQELHLYGPAWFWHI